MAQSLKERTAKGLFWGGLNNLLQQIIQTGFGIIMARILFPEDFGLIGMLAIFTLLSTCLQEGGFSVALINKRDATPLDYTTVFWTNMIISIILYIFLFFLSPFIAAFFNQPLLIPLSKVVFLSFVFSALGIVQNTIFQKELKMKELAVADIISVLSACSIGLTLALFGFSYWAIAIQAVSLPLIRTISLWVMSHWRPSLSFDKEILKSILPFSVKLMLSNMISQISGGMYSLLLGKCYDEKQVGYYSQANKWAAMPWGIIGNFINSTSLPVLSEINDDQEKQYLVLRKMVRFTAFISFPVILGFGFIASELIPIAITEKWNASIPIIQMLCIAYLFIPLTILYSNVLRAKGYSGSLLLITIIYSVSLIITLLLTVKWGIIKMLWCTFIVNILYLFFIVCTVKYKDKYSIINFIKDSFPFLGFSVFVFCITYLCTFKLENIYLILFLKIGISVLLYIVIMKISKIVIFQETMEFARDKILKQFFKK